VTLALNAIPSVIRMSPNAQVLRIYAPRSITRMQNKRTVWDRTDEEFVGEPMRTNHLALKPEVAITASVASRPARLDAHPCPFPASVITPDDFRPKPSKNGDAIAELARHQRITSRRKERHSPILSSCPRLWPTPCAPCTSVPPAMPSPGGLYPRPISTSRRETGRRRSIHCRCCSSRHLRVAGCNSPPSATRRDMGDGGSTTKRDACGAAGGLQRQLATHQALILPQHGHSHGRLTGVVVGR
jgi:hypothetical protein